MNPISYESLHQEHLKWLSEIKFWKEEIIFLRNLCRKNSDVVVPDKIYYADIFNQLNHHERLLKNLESQIYSHENFMKEMIENNNTPQLDGSIIDHDHNRQHIVNYSASFKELKRRIFRLIEKAQVK